MIQKIPALNSWLKEKLKPSLEISFVSGQLLNWVTTRLLQFGARRLIILILFSMRFLFCLKSFVWFSWHDLIYQTSLVYLIVGIHYGSMETLKKTFKGIRTARLATFFITLVLIGIVFPELIYRIFYLNYIPNVFDEARIIISLKAISQVYRNLENAIQIRRGTPPLPLGRFIGSELLLVLSFVVIIHFFGTAPIVLFWILLIDALVQEIIQWPWILRQPYRKNILWFSFKDFLKIPEINLEYLLSCFVGALIFSERFFLQNFTARLGPNSVYFYFLLLPLVSIFWRLPHLFHRYFRKSYGTLTNQISFSLFTIVFSFLLMTGIIVFTIICMLLKSNNDLPIIILFIGPVSAILAYCWYKARTLEFLTAFFWFLKLTHLTNNTIPLILTGIWVLSWLYKKIEGRGWKKHNIKLKKGNSTLILESLEKRARASRISFKVVHLFGKVYELNSSEEGIKFLKRELFALSLGEIIFNPPLENQLILTGKEEKFIPMGSYRMKSLVSDAEEGEYFLKAVQKSLSTGNRKSIVLKKGKITFGINRLGQYGATY